MPTIGVGDDYVWIGGPDEGLWLLVVVGDEAIDGGLKIDDAFPASILASSCRCKLTWNVRYWHEADICVRRHQVSFDPKQTCTCDKR
jgi:hypothetical protein